MTAADQLLDQLYSLDAGESRSPQAAALHAQVMVHVQPSENGAEALRAVLTGITTGELNWKQDRWIELKHLGEPDCGTSGCVAGWLSMRAGGVVRSFGNAVEVDGERLTVRQHAARVLGLSLAERSNQYAVSYLFDADNTLHKLWDIAAEITHGAVRCPDDLAPLVEIRDREARERTS